MAIVQNPITGRSSGSFAGAIFQTQYSKNIIRSKPVTVNVSQSDASVLVRQKFTAVTQFILTMLGFLNTIFAKAKFGKSVYSWVVGKAYTAATGGTLDAVTVDHGLVIPAPDALNMASEFGVTTAAGSIEVDWTQANVEAIVGTTNTLTIGVIDTTNGEFMGYEAGIALSASPFTITDTGIVGTESMKAYIMPTKPVRFKCASELASAV